MTDTEIINTVLQTKDPQYAATLLTETVSESGRGNKHGFDNKIKLESPLANPSKIKSLLVHIPIQPHV